MYSFYNIWQEQTLPKWSRVKKYGDHNLYESRTATVKCEATYTHSCHHSTDTLLEIYKNTHHRTHEELYSNTCDIISGGCVVGNQVSVIRVTHYIVTCPHQD